MYIPLYVCTLHIPTCVYICMHVYMCLYFCHQLGKLMSGLNCNNNPSLFVYTLLTFNHVFVVIFFILLFMNSFINNNFEIIQFYNFFHFLDFGGGWGVCA